MSMRIKSRWTVFAVFVISLALVATACGGGAEPTATPQPTATTVAATAAPRPTPTPTTPPPTPTAAPKVGGIYRTATPRDPALLAPLTSSRGTDNVRLQAVINGLLQWNPYKTPAKEVLPYLAQSWSQDGLSYTFKLRQGVKWHDGKPLIMADVLYSLDLLQKGHMKPLFSKMTKAEAVDDTTLRITLTELDPDFLVKVGQPIVAMMPSHLTPAQFQEQPIGTGPFKWAKFVTGVSVELRRNDQYFNKPFPYLDAVEVFTILDLALSRAAFLTRKLDRTDNSVPIFSDQQQIDSTKRDIPGVQFYNIHGGHQFVYFNQVPPWTDQRVRKAFHLSIDRNEFLNVYYKSIGYVWGGIWVAPALGGATGLSEEEVKTIPGFRQPKDADWAESRRLLQEAGVDGSKLEITFLTRIPYNEAPVVISQAIAKGGFTGKFNIKVFDSPVLFENLTKGSFAVAYGGFGTLVDLPEGYIPNFYLADGVQNFGKWHNAEIAELYARQAKLLDWAARGKIVNEIYRKAIEDATLPSLLNIVRPVAEQPYVRNFALGVISFFDDMNRYEQVWLDRS